MPSYTHLTDRIVTYAGATFAPASDSDLALLRSFQLPESVLDFYRYSAPSDYVERKIRSHPAREMDRDNRYYGPGCFVSPNGYIVFASTIGGDVYCFDLATDNGADGPRIVLFSHEVVSPDTTPADMTALAKPVARNLTDFLEQFIADTIDEDTIF